MSAALPTPPQPERPEPPRRLRQPPPIPNEPEDIAHREEAERVKRALAGVGIYPVDPGVYPTKDRRGFVRLTFEECWRIVAMIEGGS
jgi:hypothetical protein